MSSYEIGPAVDMVPVTPSDSGANIYRGFYVGDVSGGTTIRITTKAGNVRTIPGLVVGREYMWETTKIHLTSTTVASIFGIP